MTSKVMIKEMVTMQKALDEAIYKGHSVEYDMLKTYMALTDEIGELTHELKGDWCWWKKTVKPVDRDKVLEELVDVWHFALSIFYHTSGKACEEIIEYMVIPTEKSRDNINRIIVNIIDAPLRTLIIKNMVYLTLYLNFKLEDVYKAYIEKNKINYERLKGGY